MSNLVRMGLAQMASQLRRYLVADQNLKCKNRKIFWDPEGDTNYSLYSKKVFMWYISFIREKTTKLNLKCVKHMMSHEIASKMNFEWTRTFDQVILYRK